CLTSEDLCSHRVTETTLRCPRNRPSAPPAGAVAKSVGGPH
ncbi:MAG: hypothetical protein AVDCRST_MAG32-2476, partial [uncultured Nocardioides sp.]